MSEHCNCDRAIFPMNLNCPAHPVCLEQLQQFSINDGLAQQIAMDKLLVPATSDLVLGNIEKTNSNVLKSEHTDGSVVSCTQSSETSPPLTVKAPPPPKAKAKAKRGPREGTASNASTSPLKTRDHAKGKANLKRQKKEDLCVLAKNIVPVFNDGDSFHRFGKNNGQFSYSWSFTLQTSCSTKSADTEIIDIISVGDQWLVWQSPFEPPASFMFICAQLRNNATHPALWWKDMSCPMLQLQSILIGNLVSKERKLPQASQEEKKNSKILLMSLYRRISRKTIAPS